MNASIHLWVAVIKSHAARIGFNVIKTRMEVALSIHPFGAKSRIKLLQLVAISMKFGSLMF